MCLCLVLPFLAMTVCCLLGLRQSAQQCHASLRLADSPAQSWLPVCLRLVLQILAMMSYRPPFRLKTRQCHSILILILLLLLLILADSPAHSVLSVCLYLALCALVQPGKLPSAVLWRLQSCVSVCLLILHMVLCLHGWPAQKEQLLGYIPLQRSLLEQHACIRPRKCRSAGLLLHRG